MYKHAVEAKLMPCLAQIYDAYLDFIKLVSANQVVIEHVCF